MPKKKSVKQVKIAKELSIDQLPSDWFYKYLQRHKAEMTQEEIAGFCVMIGKSIIYEDKSKQV